MKIKAIYADITALGPEIEAIVNAANESLLGGGGVDGAIHAAAGPELLRECRTLGGCRPGEAKATNAYRLKQGHIIHTVGPRYGYTPNPDDVLRNCYLNSLKLADELGCKSIAFPSIATGIFGFPLDRAVKIFAEAVGSFEGKNIREAYMTILPGKEHMYRLYDQAIREAGLC